MLRIQNYKKNIFWIVVVIFLFTQSNLIYCQVKIEKVLLGEKITIHSEVLDEDRKILVRLPKDYEKNEKKYPVLYICDAEFFFHQTVSAVQYLSECEFIRNHPIPQLIIVGIINVDRNRDYTPTYAPVQGQSRFPTSGKAKEFIKFLKTELVPFIQENYKVHPYRILSGWSLGGLFTVYTFLEYPELFSAYIAISPSLSWDNQMIIKKTDSMIKEKAISSKPLVIALGSLEGSGMKGAVKDLFANKMSNLSNMDLSFHFTEIPQENHSYVPIKAIYEGLKILYQDWVMPAGVAKKGLGAIKAFYNDLSKKYGYQVIIPESAYTQLIGSVATNEEALKMALLYKEKYPNSSYAHFILGIRYERLINLPAAERYLLKAIELENNTEEPDSERLLVYNLGLKRIKKEHKK